MNRTKAPILFFAGTDTDVGKTYVAAMVVEELRHSGFRVGVYKPVASGCSRDGDQLVSSDAVRLWDAAGRVAPLSAVCPQRFAAPLAPHLAAALEGKTIDEKLLIEGIRAVADGMDLLVVEGAGGLMSPLSENMLNSDLARQLDAEVIIVVANRLGAIHQALATVTTAAAMNLKVLGFVLNQVDEQGDLSVTDNAIVISRFSKVPILAEVSYGDKNVARNSFRDSLVALCEDKISVFGDKILE